MFQGESAQPHFRPGLLRQAIKFLRSIFPCDFAALHINKTIRQTAEIIEPVFRYDDGFPLTFPESQGFPQVGNGCRIQIGGWLIQYQYLRLHDRHAGAGNFLFLSSGEVEDIPVHQLFQSEITDRPLQPRPDCFCRLAQIFTAKGDLAGCIYIKKLGTRVLEHAAHDFRRIIERLF